MRVIVSVVLIVEEGYVSAVVEVHVHCEKSSKATAYVVQSKPEVGHVKVLDVMDFIELNLAVPTKELLIKIADLLIFYFRVN